MSVPVRWTDPGGIRLSSDTPNPAVSTNDAGPVTQVLPVAGATSSSAAAGGVIVSVVGAAMSTSATGPAYEVRANVLDTVQAAEHTSAAGPAVGVLVTTGTASHTLAGGGFRTYYRRTFRAPQRTTKKALGCGVNEAWLVESNGRRHALHGASIQWAWSLDKTAQATIITKSILAKGAKTWDHEIEISRDGKLVFVGPLVSVSDQDTLVTLTASDITGWASVTPVPIVGRSFIDVDWSRIAQHLIVVDALNGVRVEEVNVEDCGTLGSLTINPNELRMVSDAVSAALPFTDVAAVGRKLYIDGRPMSGREVVGTLTEKDFTNKPRFWTDGFQSPDIVWCRGANGLVQRYPDADTDARRTTKAVHAVIDRPDLMTQPEVYAAARARWQAQSTTPHVDTGGGQLLPTAAFDLDQAVPGRLVRVQADYLGETITTLNRITDINVAQAGGDGGGGSETVSIALAALEA